MVSRVNQWTPPEWRHVKIEPDGPRAFRIRTAYAAMPITPLDLEAMQLGRQTRTIGLSKAAALKLAGQIEAWIKAENLAAGPSQDRKGRSRRG